jgi:hypothetical protein
LRPRSSPSPSPSEFWHSRARGRSVEGLVVAVRVNIAVFFLGPQGP